VSQSHPGSGSATGTGPAEVSRVGVLGAMQSEIGALVAAMDVREQRQARGFDYWQGVLFGRDCVVARCGMGKVSAAAGVQRLVDRFEVDCVVVCGLAGGLADDVRLGDVVIGERFLQHDLDASPIFPRYHVPALGTGTFEAPQWLAALAEKAAAAFLASPDMDALRPGLVALAGRPPRLQRGLIVTGDQFIKDDQRQEIRRNLPDALCVEMEGAAVAQVCDCNAVPFCIVRVISDNADSAAPGDFLRFVEETAPAYTVGIVRELLARLD
jgi:adenosylhomocysteine nucleosidase